MIARRADGAHLQWLRWHTGADLSAKATGIAAVDKHGRTRGVVALDNWTENACHCHIALEAPIAARKLMPAVAEYVFEQLGLGVLLGVIQGSNAKSLELARRLGFREVYRMRGGWSKGVDLVFLELRREECRFLKRAA